MFPFGLNVYRPSLYVAGWYPSEVGGLHRWVWGGVWLKMAIQKAEATHKPVSTEANSDIPKTPLLQTEPHQLRLF